MSKSLAVKYRPTTFNDVVEQSATITILKQQLESGETKNAYLFCGGAGTGKTTCARIFANEINNHEGNPIEMDAASNSGVDDVREIINQAKTKSINSEYKVFIIDECHSISNTGWQAFLKLIEEPPAKSIFIFCTTDPQKIPKTILSRVQRFDFQRISHKEIVNRLHYILNQECIDGQDLMWDHDALDYIAKIADGGMRDAITLMDKCLAYSKDLLLENVVEALGLLDYEEMMYFLEHIIDAKYNYCKVDPIIEFIEEVHRSGRDLKQFVKQFTEFVLDVQKFCICGSTEYTQIPKIYESELAKFANVTPILSIFVKLNADIKWETSPKALIEATILMECSK